MDKYISAAQLTDNLGISYQTLYRWTKAGDFPAPVKLGPRATAWREADVKAWEASRRPVAYAAGAEA